MAIGVTARTTGAIGLLPHRGAGDGAPTAGTRSALPLQSSSLRTRALCVRPSTFPLDTTFHVRRRRWLRRQHGAWP